MNPLSIQIILVIFIIFLIIFGLKRGYDKLKKQMNEGIKNGKEKEMDNESRT